VPLCGHATLASSHVLWEAGILAPEATATFETRSGRLTARRKGGRIELDLPAAPVTERAPPAGALEALGATAVWVGRTGERGLGDVDYLVEVGSEEAVRRLTPDFGRLRSQRCGFIVTARATTAPFDFVSRYFAAFVGIDEDPVTGVAHCALVPYWGAKLSKSEMTGYQASPRGGVVHGVNAGARVLLSGEAVTVLRGELLA
jgi:predicted PhzF superfamily epimerase YddE/YHI9